MTKSVLITGCSSGIGLYCATELQKLDFHVIASARNEQDVATLKALGLDAVLIDLSNEQSINDGFKEALTLANGRLFALFNNGAYGQPGAVEDLPTSVLRAQFEANFFGWHTLTNLAIKEMRKHGQGRIIQNSSVLGLVALRYRGAYNASKFALEGLTDTLRLELSGSGIQVSLIEPGPILSDFRKNAKTAFLNHIDWQQSHHITNYRAQLKRLDEDSAPQKFTLGPEAVLKPLLHALRAKKAKPRYYVTFPTYLMGILKRLLSTSLLDKFLIKGH